MCVCVCVKEGESVCANVSERERGKGREGKKRGGASVKKGWIKRGMKSALFERDRDR